MAEGARLESVFPSNRNAGSNPALSARFIDIKLFKLRAFLIELLWTDYLLNNY